jgi:hypothetical protein
MIFGEPPFSGRLVDPKPDLFFKVFQNDVFLKDARRVRPAGPFILWDIKAGDYNVLIEATLFRSRCVTFQ